MPNAQYAKVMVKRCPMSDDACVEAVIKHVESLAGAGFDARQAIEINCGRYTRGRNKGKLRGWANIHICYEGGWFKNGPGYMNGRVVYPNTVMGVSVTDYLGKEYFHVGESF